MTATVAADPTTGTLTRIERLSAQIRKAEREQKARVNARYDLMVEAREAGASWAAIDRAAGVRNSQALVKKMRGPR